jgi:hypothetical protein
LWRIADVDGGVVVSELKVVEQLEQVVVGAVDLQTEVMQYGDEGQRERELHPI